MRTFIIAEAGVNHNGDEKLATALVEAAAKSGADAVKFQTFSADKLTRKGAEKAEYQEQATGEGDQHGMLKALEMSENLHRRLFAHCSELGIEFMSTAFDEESLDFLIELGIKRIKVPSGEITNAPLLRHMAKKGLPLIVSTGMAALDEVVAAVDIIRAARAAHGFVEPLVEKVTILHCTSNYPTDSADVNLRAMNTLARTTGLPVGYSDHTLGLAVSTAAVALGATVIEKHFTLDAGLPGPDHKASLEPDQLCALVQQIRDVEAARIRCQGADGVGASGAQFGPAQRYHGACSCGRCDGGQG
jgi:N,N'-diacetyllegionaminate synthase